MNQESRARRQSLRVIISEAMMVLAVIATVVILVLLASGYGINSDFEVERQGMLQIYSYPTGASVKVDGDAPWYQRTNTSKVLSAGEHEIILSLDGYDSWSKVVTIGEGLLYRVHYPRLFLLEREAVPIYDAKDVTFATVSPDRKYLIMTGKDASTWTLLDLDRTEPRASKLDFSSILPASATVISAEWNLNNNRVLLKTSAPESEWVLLNINNASESVNLTREFSTKFDEARIFDSSADNLLVLQSGNLKKIDLPARKISSTIAKNVVSYGFYGNEIIFSDGETIGLVKNNDTTITTVGETTKDARVFLSRFYEDRYITIITDSNIQVLKRSDFSEIFAAPLDFSPSTIKVAIYGDFVFMKKDDKVATLDMEALTIRDWELAGRYGWLDNSMIYQIIDGALSVYDFDGLNHRALSSAVSAQFPVTVSGDRYLYYFSGDSLMRELIVQ